ncbi:component of IIS longevity pathway SMK-1-domain-containing protein [Lyophyllum atratum]|nr:component of IIS longevity pathway SMK-1-domain-containing protein [Lyophyllum atratum]
MNSDAGHDTQPQSLLTPAAATTDPSGAGSTIPNTRLSADSTSTPLPASTLSPAPGDSNTTTTPVPEPSGSSQGTSTESASSQGATGNKGQEHVAEVAEPPQSLESIKDEREPLLHPVNQQIELLEHTPDSLIDDGQDWAPDGDHELKRVKVYELIGARWMDQGTAFCFGQFQEETSEALLIARSERSYNEIILSTVIRSNDVYQRQQDTLIVWTEPDGVDYALSFQDPEGCSEVWNFICDVQRHMNGGDDQANITSSPQIGPEPASVTSATIIRSGHLPRPELGIIGEIDRAIKTLARTQNVKERICEYIQQEDYVKSLIEVMNTAEDLESLENLHALCSLMQTILMLNDHTMYEHILEDDLFFGVVGMLEYDPDFPTHKANYREFLHQTSHFHQPIPIRDASIQRKIHHTYRLQFLKDVVLARALDDSTFNVLNSCIIFNQIDIIGHIQTDHSFLREIVKLFVDESMLNAGAGPAPPSTTNGGPGKKAPIPGQPQSPLPIGPNGNGDSATSDKGGDPNAMDVDEKQPPASPKRTNGTTSPLANGRATTTPAPPPSSPRPTHYAFAPPDNLSEEELAKRREVIVLVQQLCIMGKNVQLAARMALFRSLVDRGVLFGVQWAITLPERDPTNKPMISAGGEILVALLDHDLNGVRGHVLKQVVAIEKERAGGRKGADKAETILEMACRIMAQSGELAVQSQVGDALKVWMDLPPDTPSMLAAGAGAPDPASTLAAGTKGPIRKEDPGTERYMDYFYKDCIHILFKPFYDLPEWRNAKEPVLPLTREEANRYVYLCDLLYNFVSQHHFRIHFYMMSSNIIVRVASLLKARDKHLRHAAFRNFRVLLRQNNPNIHTQIMKHDILKPILDLTIQESRRDNLLSCSCQEYFDTMRRENMKELAKFCMAKHEAEIRRLAQSPLGGPRFEQFIAWWQWEMHQQNKEPIPEDSKSDNALDARGWPQGRALDAEEEDYFNADDDEEDLIPVVGQSWPRIAVVGTPPVSNNLLKRKRRMAVGNSPKGYRPPLRTPVLGSLVDYGEDDEEDAERPPPSLTKNVGSSHRRTSLSPSPEVPPASPKLSHRQAPVALSGPPPKRASADDDDDNLLEALARSRSRPQSPAPGMMSSMESLRSSEKRRRDEDDDDDELMGRLSKAKKPDLGVQKERFGFGNISRTKNGDDPPKKIKVKLGASSLAVASTPTPVPSETGAKDGDTG